MAAPPTYPNHPSASAPDPAIEGITIISSSNHGKINRWVFKINEGEERAAIVGLLNALENATEFSLSDHSRGDYESAATYKKKGDCFKTMLGGHGWSGDWRSLNYERAIEAALTHAKYNYGTTVNEVGRITKNALVTK